MKRILLYFGVILTVFIIPSCVKEYIVIPGTSAEAFAGVIILSSVEMDTIVQDTVVVQSKVSLISIEPSNSGATIKGVVEGAVGLTDFAYGVCWGVSPNPTIENNYSHPIRFEKPDRFEITISNLKANTRYYIRPYILKSNQYFYGEKSGEFTTSY